MSAQVLVTGAAGFIGSHLTEELLARGKRVKAFVRYNSTADYGWLKSLSSSQLKNLEVVAGDIRDASIVRDAVRGCETVYHLAALIGIPYSYISPEAYVATNVQGTLNVLQAAREFRVGRIVHTSTSEVYGSAQTVPISEEHRIFSQSPYAATKASADQLAVSYHCAFELPVVVVRPFNTFGPRQSLRAVIPTIIAQIASGKTEIHLGALHTTRDFTFVTDTVSGFICAADSPRGAGEVINLGTGTEISITDLAELIGQIMGVSVTIAQSPERKRPELSEVERLCSDNRKALKMIGWKPALSGLEGLRRGLELTSKWFSQPENLSRYPTKDRYVI